VEEVLVLELVPEEALLPVQVRMREAEEVALA
jgi:hypothetical protein